MHYSSLHHCLQDLESSGQLIRIREPIDPDLEMAEIQRRTYQAGGPALYFERVKGSNFPAISNLYGTLDRCHWIFRSTLRRVEQMIELKADASAVMRHPIRYAAAPFAAWKALPKRVRTGPILAGKTTISELPQIRSWPMDGGPFITLPQVYTNDPDHPGPMHANLGMYRVQMAGNRYLANQQVGLHYQIHRGIGVHHARAIARGEKLKVSIFLGGPPAHTLAAIMPLPEGLSELLFAGLLSGRRFRWLEHNGHTLSADADFCICGTINAAQTLPEGPFGDHLGYYSLSHDFPVLEVESVWHRKDAVWPFTVVGRPPQEDTVFGQLIHELTGPMVPVSLPGLDALHAVDAAGVHPLLLAIGHERYVPYQRSCPQELLTIAHSILGFGQASLAKYLWIAAREDDEHLNIHDVSAVLQHVLARIDWTRDLHFHTRTTIDTLDYSGSGLNSGSKLVLAALGPPVRTLAPFIPDQLTLQRPFGHAAIALPGILVIEGPPFQSEAETEDLIQQLSSQLKDPSFISSRLPLIVIVDDAEFTARSLHNFVWVTFTRSNPSHDVHGINSFITHKHWGCRGSLVIDARCKPHHAPVLEVDPAVSDRVDALASQGGPLHGIF